MPESPGFQCFCIAFFGVWLLGVEFLPPPDESHSSESPVAVQETRIDALKISLARQERKVEELFENCAKMEPGRKKGKGRHKPRPPKTLRVDLSEFRRIKAVSFR